MKVTREWLENNTTVDDVDALVNDIMDSDDTVEITDDYDVSNEIRTGYDEYVLFTANVYLKRNDDELELTYGLYDIFGTDEFATEDELWEEVEEYVEDVKLCDSIH